MSIIVVGLSDFIHSIVTEVVGVLRRGTLPLNVYGLRLVWSLRLCARIDRRHFEQIWAESGLVSLILWIFR